MKRPDHIFTHELETRVTQQQTLLLVGDDEQVVRFTMSNTEVTEKKELDTIDQATIDGFIAQEEAKLVDTDNLLERGHKIGLIAGVGAAALSFFTKLGDVGLVEDVLISSLFGGVFYGLVGQALPRAEILRVTPSNEQRLRRIKLLRNVPVNTDNQ